MPAQVVVAVLAHELRETLDDLVDNIRWALPDAEIVFFNGGTDASLLRGIDAEVCPASHPLKLGNIVPFHWEVMQWLGTRPFDYLITLDADMLFVRRGFAGALDVMMADSEYMGASYVIAGPWYPTWDSVRRFNLSWPRWWQPLFKTKHGSWALNPGLVFRREYVEKLRAFDATPRVLARARRSRLYGIEEFVWASFASAMRCRPMANPGSVGIRYRYHSPASLRASIEHPDVYVLHKMPMALDHPHRRIVADLRASRDPDWSIIGDPTPAATPVNEPVAGQATPRPERGLRAWAKDRYFQLLP
jgi:hypothetical protein